MPSGEMKKAILTAVVPVKHFDNNRDTLQVLFSRCKNLSINLVIVLDSDNKDEFSKLESLVLHSQNFSIKVMQKEFNSPGLTRNAGIDLSTTEWLAFWDADDFPEPSEYLEMIRVSDAAQTHLCVGSYATLDFKSDVVVQRPINVTHKYEWLVNPGLWRCVFRANYLNDVKFTALRMGEDIQFLAEFISLLNDWSFYEPVVYHYVINRNGQATSKKPSTEELLTAFSKLVEISGNRSGKSFALSMIICSRLATLAKNPRTYFGAVRILGAGFLSGKLRAKTFTAALARVISLKLRQKGA